VYRFFETHNTYQRSLVTSGGFPNPSLHIDPSVDAQHVASGRNCNEISRAFGVGNVHVGSIESGIGTKSVSSPKAFCGLGDIGDVSATEGMGNTGDKDCIPSSESIVPAFHDDLLDVLPLTSFSIGRGDHLDVHRIKESETLFAQKASAVDSRSAFQSYEDSIIIGIVLLIESDQGVVNVLDDPFVLDD
jgi:hypothetical protein